MVTVRYLVNDVEAAVAFYTEHLGFTLKQQFGPAMAILIRDGLLLSLAAVRSQVARALHPEVRARPARCQWVTQ